MNSIETDGKLEKARFLFEDKLRPFFKKKKYFSLKADRNLETYYETRKKTVFTSIDFEISDISIPSNFEKELTALWQSKKDVELFPLAEWMAQYALDYGEQEKEDQEEVSPFIYVMF